MAMAVSSVEYRRALVKYLSDEGALHSARVAEALLTVPRELFVPGLPLEEVYRPADAIITKRVEGISLSSASAPEVIALMLEQLDPRPGQRVLEIGAGTGYNAALLARLVGPAGSVVTIDIDEDICDAARSHLAEVGLDDRVTVVQSDGALGFPGAVFDRIILTVASGDIAPAWREQLAPHGRLVLPLSLGGPQRCVAFVPQAEYLVAHGVRNCSFISLRGAMAAPDAGQLELEAIMRGRQREFSTGIRIGRWETSGVHLWLVVRLPGVTGFWTRGESDADRTNLCLTDGHAVVLLGRADESDELVVATSETGSALAARVLDLLREWDSAGRPGDAALEIRAYDRTRAPPLGVGEVALEQRWTTFVLRWRPSP
jgi:protein-L-isoaspartate(D-aspartate) O-methyltransferase